MLFRSAGSSGRGGSRRGAPPKKRVSFCDQHGHVLEAVHEIPRVQRPPAGAFAGRLFFFGRPYGAGPDGSGAAAAGGGGYGGSGGASAWAATCLLTAGALASALLYYSSAAAAAK